MSAPCPILRFCPISSGLYAGLIFQVVWLISLAIWKIVLLGNTGGELFGTLCCVDCNGMRLACADAVCCACAAQPWPGPLSCIAVLLEFIFASNRLPLSTWSKPCSILSACLLAAETHLARHSIHELPGVEQVCPELSTDGVDYHIWDSESTDHLSSPPQDDIALVVDITPDPDVLQQLKLLLQQV